MRWWKAIGCALGVAVCAITTRAHAQDASSDPAPARTELIEVDYQPVGFAQIAVWIETADGEFLRTLALTEATARRGIGNRPGASQMNSGFRWPYGRREGVLPTWASRRAAAPDAEPFRRVIFQDRRTEGLASRTSADYSRDDYFCLSFDRSRANKDALDAVSCASVFNSDKGRFITDDDIAGGYGEPFEDLATGEGRMEPLSYHSLYPPRIDVEACAGTCFDHPDAVNYGDHVRSVMPEIDVVAMATPSGEQAERLLFSVPPEWDPGAYQICLEINVEGDYNDSYNGTLYPTPMTPSSMWDAWATGYGYPYRGQPSVVYCAPFELGLERGMTATSADPVGSVSTWDTTAPDYGELYGMQGMTDDPQLAPGQGADRLRRMQDGSRLRVQVKPPLSCASDAPPSAVSNLALSRHPTDLHAHEWARLTFDAAADDHGLFRYDVRISKDKPIVDEASFMEAAPATAAALEAYALSVPVEAAGGERVSVDIGGLVQNSEHWVGMRAVDLCDQPGELVVVQYQTPTRQFTTVSPCFIATAAYGTPLAQEIGWLRRMRDKYLQSNAVGRAFVSAYYEYGPALARRVGQSEGLRGAVRWALTPLVWLAQALED